jgi:hypothetical protein
MKFYVALRFRERPDLHMTLNHRGFLDDVKLAAFIAEVDAVMKLSEPAAFAVVLDRREIFGFKAKVRVLLPSSPIPQWVHQLTKPKWAAHVACDEDKLELLADSVCIMSHQQEVRRWDLRQTDTT